jgi:hypothetical protein
MAKSRKSKKGSIRGEFSPVLRALAKKKPRGIPFPKGNPIGRETRFVKGAPSANPGGKPKVAKLNAAIREGLALESDEKLPLVTNAQVLAAQVIKQARNGNLAAITLAGDRAEGRPAQSVTIDDSRDKFDILISSMTERSRIIGPSEDDYDDDSTPLLEAGNEEDSDV